MNKILNKNMLKSIVLALIIVTIAVTSDPNIFESPLGKAMGIGELISVFEFCCFPFF